MKLTEADIDESIAGALAAKDRGVNTVGLQVDYALAVLAIALATLRQAREEKPK